MQVKATIALGALLMSGAVLAQTKAPEPDYTLSFNVGGVTEYRYRGISQTRFKPALQGGADFAHKSGFYVGTWASTINWIKDNSSVPPVSSVKGPVELDIYGGYKFDAAGLGWDLGYLRYQYVSNTLANTGRGGVYKNANTDELYAAATFGVATLKYSYATSNLFGNYDFTRNRKTTGSSYLDLTFNLDLGNGWSLAPHVGHQTIKNIALGSYTDYSLTLGKDLGNGFSVSAAAVGTNADRGFYASPVNGKFLGKNNLVLGAKYSF